MSSEGTRRALARPRLGHSSLAILLVLTIMPSGSVSPATGDEGRVPEELQLLHQALRRSRVGQSLLKAIEAPGAAGLESGLALLAERLESEVRSRTTVPVHAADLEFIDAARELRLVPRGIACEATVAIMGLIDEWSARATGACDRRDISARFILRLREQRPPGGSRSCPWLEGNFPLLYRDAERIVRSLT